MGRREATLDTLCPGEVPPSTWDAIWKKIAGASGVFLDGHRQAVEQGRAALHMLRWHGDGGGVDKMGGGFFITGLVGPEGSADLVILSATGRYLVSRESTELIRRLAAANRAWRVIATVRNPTLARRLGMIGWNVIQWGGEFLVEASAYGNAGDS